ncbi:MAG: AAA family ATPase [Chitinispirillaceae bacterium]|nr:AAA family ATPase [Chitinispirillaceae bacterium]
MSIEKLSRLYELLDTVSSSDDTDVTVIRHRKNGELFLLKRVKERAGQAVPELKLRFKREIDILSSLDHPNIARPVLLPDAGDTDSIAYPYRKGQSLSSLLDVVSIFSSLEAMHFMRQLLDALEYLHGRGIVHCDINPDNLYVDDDKGLQLLDFGLSMTEDEAAQMPEGRTVGTIPWLSPEQTGFTASRIDARSDLYGAGLILYRLLAGGMPFELVNNTVEELLNVTLHTEVQPLRGMPISINAMLLKALNPSPDERYQTAAGFKHDIVEIMDHIKNETHERFVAGRRDAVIAISRSRLFVGRSRETDALKDGLARLLQGRGFSFCIYGGSGIGKTEIVREFRRGVREDNCLFLSIKCNGFTPHQPYSVFRMLVLDFIARIGCGGTKLTDSFSEMAERLLAGCSGIICKIVPEMRPFFREVRPIDIVEPEKEAGLIAHVLFTLFSSMCAFRPLVVFIDDVQWIDLVSFEIIRRMLGRSETCMTIFTLRTKEETDFRVHGMDLRKAGINTFLAVTPFTRAEIDDLAVLRFGRVVDRERFVNLLVDKTDHSPFALAETFRFLVNSEVLATNGRVWSLSAADAVKLPLHLDPLSFILGKIDDLGPEERQWLETASLAEGRFRCDLIETAGGFPPGRSGPIVERLDNAGFIKPLLGGGYYFVHDRIQESVRGRLSQERKFSLYENFGATYEEMAVRDREFLFRAAEAYLKSRNVEKAINLSYQAARHAADKAALDIASRYFTRTHLLATQTAKTGLKPPVDMVKLQVEFGDVLMLTGRNEQALKMYEKLLEEKHGIEGLKRLDIQYKIGTIHHNTGNFDVSIRYFMDALRKLGIRFYGNQFLVAVALLIEVLKQTASSLGLKYIIPKKNTPERILSVRILNKLSYSLFFKNILLVQYAHFRALNMADRLADCAERIETYSTHTVVSFMLSLKKRAFSYFRKALVMSARINRKDALAFTYTTSGLTHYYNGNWKAAEHDLMESIAVYKSIGDRWGQVVPLETLVFLELKKGNLSECQPLLGKLLLLDEDCNDQRGLANVHTFTTLINFLNEKDSPQDWKTLNNNRDTLLNNVPLNKAHSGFILQYKLLFENHLKDAHALSDSILSDIKKNNLIQEYVAGAFADRCEILIKEFFNRHHADKSQKQIDLSDRTLLQQLRKFIILAFVRGIMYPAHRGAALRALAWYNAFRKRKRTARFFFRKAVNSHHKLGMLYEKAKSLRDFGLFFEEHSEPGHARDCFNRAYQLFDRCGASLECGRLQDSVDAEFSKRAVAAARETSGAAMAIAAGEVAQIRMDTLYDASLSLTDSGDMDRLLRRIIGALIRVTGAQYGFLRLDGDDRHEPCELALDFENRERARESIAWSDVAMRRAEIEKRIVKMPDPAETGGTSGVSRKAHGSALCVPFVRGARSLGCTYLANRLVEGLFSDNAVKAAQIIAAQAGFLIENARLVEEYKLLTAHLEKKVKEQTGAINEQNDMLQATNLRLIESERMKWLLTGTMVHDIKNFAAAISGHLRLVSYRYPDDKKMLRSVDLSVESCADIVNLTSNLLDMNRMEEGKLTLQPRRMYFEEIAALAQKYGRNVLFDERNISVAITPPSDREFSVLADPYLLERVVQNLFSNAAKYTEPGGKAALVFAETDRENILSFFSSGPPIPEEQRDIVFEKYSRIDGRASQYSKGLGLFFCKMVMNAHKGRIWVDAEKDGNCFKLGFRRI